MQETRVQIMNKRIELKKCLSCYGQGKMMGGGMMQVDCDTCDGRGKVEKPIEDDIDYLLSKESEHYKNAKEKIKSISETISDEQAEKILDEEIEKQKPIDIKGKKRG